MIKYEDMNPQAPGLASERQEGVSRSNENGRRRKKNRLDQMPKHVRRRTLAVLYWTLGALIGGFLIIRVVLMMTRPD